MVQVNSYEAYNEFLNWAHRELKEVEAGNDNPVIKPVDFKKCVFGLCKFLLEESLKGNAPKEGFSLEALEALGKYISKELYKLSVDGEYPNTREKLSRAQSTRHYSHQFTEAFNDVVEVANLVANSPEEKRTSLLKALLEKYYHLGFKISLEDDTVKIMPEQLSNTEVRTILKVPGIFA